MLKRLFASIFILLFIALSFNKVANWHTHVINGVIVQHAHSNSDNSTQHHSHSNAELSFISITDGNYWDQIQFNFLPQIIETKVMTYQLRALLERSLIVGKLPNKSPPFLMS